MKSDEIEAVYQAVARKLSDLGPARAETFLAKLVLLLANELPSAAVALQLIDRAAHGFDVKYPQRDPGTPR
jgi:hypothetical protein